MRISDNSSEVQAKIRRLLLKYGYEESSLVADYDDGSHGAMSKAVLGKPTGEADAHRMLRALSGRAHRVISGVCVTTAERCESFADTSIVHFAELTDDEIDYYIEHYRPLDKAGAYGIQEWIGNIGISGINGDFYNVMGLPTRKLYQLLKTF